jgi:hypothetical protein
MKKHFLSITAIALTAGTLVFTGCSKDDVNAPEVTLIGGDVTINLQGTYTEQGATATDDKDGAITPSMSGNVDVNKTGVYVITYSATDAAGNTGEATRNVTVVNAAAAAWEGTYSATEKDANPLYTYTKPVTLTASTEVNNRVYIDRLGDFANNKVYMTITGNVIDIPSQTTLKVGTGSGCDVSDRTTKGSGAKTATGFTLTYDDAKVNGCTGSRTGVAATFIKN